MTDPMHKRPAPHADDAMVWLARCAAILLALALVVYVGFFLLPGIYAGSIQEMSKHGAIVFNRAQAPVSFWITVGFHMAVAAVTAYLDYLCLVKAAWIKRQKTIDGAARKLGDAMPNASKPISLWVVIAVLAAFFYLIAKLAGTGLH